MSGIVVEAAVQFIVEKLLSCGTEEIGLSFSVKIELAKLNKSFAYLLAFLHDAARHQLEDEVVKLWLKEVEDVAYEADNLLDEFHYETLCRQSDRNTAPKQPLENSEVARRIKDLQMKLTELDEEAKSYGLRTRNFLGGSSSSSSQGNEFCDCRSICSWQRRRCVKNS